MHIGGFFSMQAIFGVEQAGLEAYSAEGSVVGGVFSYEVFRWLGEYWWWAVPGTSGRT